MNSAREFSRRALMPTALTTRKISWADSDWGSKIKAGITIFLVADEQDRNEDEDRDWPGIRLFYRALAVRILLS
jgi:hypothetical protein